MPKIDSLRCLMAGGLLALCVACRDSAAPLDAALSGAWRQIGVDTYSELVLQQRGTSVTGAMGGGGPFDFTFRACCEVTGTASLPEVKLEWNDGARRILFDAVLSGNDSILSGTMSVNGGTPVTVQGYHRVPSP